jgi:hypothetical protein
MNNRAQTADITCRNPENKNKLLSAAKKGLTNACLADQQGLKAPLQSPNPDIIA